MPPTKQKTIPRILEIHSEPFQFLSKRLESFKIHGWIHKNYKSTPQTMSQAGFYRPNNSSEDNVTCFLCNKCLDGWEEGDDSFSEHKSHAPYCPLVCLDSPDARRITFSSNNWPHIKQKNLSPSNMSMAGFYFFPKEKGDDSTFCFQCGLALNGWEGEDDAMAEHSKRRPGCPFVKGSLVMHPCSYEYLLASKPDKTGVSHISSSTLKKEDEKFKIPTKTIAVNSCLEGMTIEEGINYYKEKIIKRYENDTIAILSGELNKED